ncbi:hypothetical protein RchiOBHm_Chr1g0334271 [Rosa chinensis]|uniref:Uncharacterized protein n=1 Tax=Rosa chinensis TaxID=74649 RepID=A0A2P6SC87_ROSCH|nr:hypothetical protein RchiOBHm_Chr1g0334271 [Rosa chinensis]
MLTAASRPALPKQLQCQGFDSHTTLTKLRAYSKPPLPCYWISKPKLPMKSSTPSGESIFKHIKKWQIVLKLS